MDKLADYRQGLLETYQATAEILEDALRLLPSERLLAPDLPDGRNPHQLAAHLRDLEAQMYLPYFEKILTEDMPGLAGFDPRGWAGAHYRPGEPLQDILAEFQGLRAEVRRRLGALPAEAWRRTARHPRWGVRTLQWWLEHDLATTRRHLRALVKQ